MFVTARFVRDTASGPLVHLIVCFRDGAARERGQQEQADLVSTVAHELRSPLTSVQGLHRDAAQPSGTGSPTTRSGTMLETVNADADRVTRLITELLDVSRIDAGRLEVHRQVVDIPGAVARAVRALVTLGQDPERFVLEVGAGLPDMWLDPDKVDQVLTNLLDNAVRHGAGTVVVTVQPERGGAMVSVQDERRRHRTGDGRTRSSASSGATAAAAAPASACTSSRGSSRPTAGPSRSVGRPTAAPSSGSGCPPAHHCSRNDLRPQPPRHAQSLDSWFPMPCHVGA